MRLKPVLRGLLCVTGIVATFGTAVAQSFPNKPVKLIVATAPGGAPDVVARVLGEKLSQLLGQPFIVENRPGGGGSVGTGQVARMQPDGYSLLVVEMGQLVINPHLQTGVTYNPVKDFTPVGLAATTPLYFVANTKTSIKSLSDLMRRAQARPGTLNYGSSGIGSLHHLAMEVFKKQTGLNIVHVPFKGAGQSTPALLGGEVEILVSGLQTIKAFVQDGRVNLLAVTTAQRSPDTPDVPAVSEMIKDYDFSAEIGIIGPAGLPRDVLMRLSTAMKTALEAPETQTKLKVTGAMPTWSSPEDYAQNIRVKFKKFGEFVKISGANAN